MSDMKCPFCNGELKRDYYDCGMLECHNPKCKHYYDDFIGREELWQELIRTRKALDIAKNAINSVVDHNIINCMARGIDPRTDDTSVTLCNALEQITALEQKD